MINDFFIRALLLKKWICSQCLRENCMYTFHMQNSFFNWELILDTAFLFNQAVTLTN
jgi:hypothetical protein